LAESQSKNYWTIVYIGQRWTFSNPNFFWYKSIWNRINLLLSRVLLV